MADRQYKHNHTLTIQYGLELILIIIIILQLLSLLSLGFLDLSYQI